MAKLGVFIRRYPKSDRVCCNKEKRIASLTSNLRSLVSDMYLVEPQCISHEEQFTESMNWSLCRFLQVYSAQLKYHFLEPIPSTDIIIE